MPTKYEAYELDAILHSIKEDGFAFVNKYRVWRLLGKGSGAAGTWKAFLDSWEELSEDNKREDVHCFEIGWEYFITHKLSTSQMVVWAGEK